MIKFVMLAALMWKRGDRYCTVKTTPGLLADEDDLNLDLHCHLPHTYPTHPPPPPVALSRRVEFLDLRGALPVTGHHPLYALQARKKNAA